MDARPLAAILLGLLVTACDDGPERAVPSLDDYPVATPAPLPSVGGVPLEAARFRVSAADVRYRTDDALISIGRLETTLDGSRPSEADLFEVRARALTDGAAGWSVSADALLLRDLRLIGDARGATLLPSRLVADLPGRPRMIGTLAGRVVSDADGTLRGDIDASMDASSISMDGALTAAGRWNAVVALRTLALADAHAFLDAVPAHGIARGTLSLSGGNGALAVRSRDLILLADSSRVRLSGAAARSAAGTWTLDDVEMLLEPVHQDDWRAWLGSEPPVDAPLRGRLFADGSGRDGIEVDGWILAEDAGSRLAADVRGTLWMEPEPRLDLDIESRSLRLAGTGPLDLDVSLSGGADSLAIIGSARLAELADGGAETHPLLASLPRVVIDRFGDSELRIDANLLRSDGARRVSGSAEIVDSAGRAWVLLRGAAPLGGDGAIDVTASADSLPLALLPVPAQIRNLEGFARVRARATGTVANPAIVADAELVDFRFEVPEYGTGVDSMRALVRLAGTSVELVDVVAFHGGGSLALSGGLSLGAPLDLRDPGASLEGASLDVVALLDTMTIVDIDSARAVVAGRITATGALDRPHVAGRVDVVEGHVFEGKLAPSSPLDPDDPPYGALAARAPWPTGRVSRVAPPAEDDASAPPLTADVTLALSPGFRIVDEDSDLGALGGIRLVIDERGADARGDARIVDGFYAYYGELFQLAGGAFAVDGGTTRLAMSGELRGADRPLGLGQGGYDGLDRRDPPIGIFGYSTPATVLELLRRRTPLPATQPELAALLLFDVPVQPVDVWNQELLWRGDEPDDLVGHRSAIQGSGLLWSYLADELYDYVPLAVGYLRAGTIRIGSRYPGWIMLGTQLEAAVHLGPRLTARASHVVAGEAWPGVGLRFALRDDALQPAHRHLELFNEPRFTPSMGTSGPRPDFDSRRRTGMRVRWLWDY